MPAASARCVQNGLHRVSGGIGVASDIEPAQDSTTAAWRRGDWPKVPRPSARSAARSVATAWSRCLRRRRARRRPPRRNVRRCRAGRPWLVAACRSEPCRAEPIKAVRIEPGAMHAGDPAIEVGDAGDHRRPGLGRQVLVRRDSRQTRMEAQGCPVVHVSVMPRAADRPRRRSRQSDCEMANSRLAASCDPRGAGRAGAWTRFRFRAWQAEKAPRLVERPRAKSRSPRLSRMMSSRSPCSPVAASVLCAVEHKTEYVAPRVMLRICDWALSRGRSTASTQHNVSASREVA